MERLWYLLTGIFQEKEWFAAKGKVLKVYLNQ